MSQSQNIANPIIIIGMHRSGTSLLTRILEKFGVFVGYKKNPNNESQFFESINHWMLNQVNATWDNPYNFQFINNDIIDKFVEVINYQFTSSRRKLYLGDKKKNYKDIRHCDFCWGWKDPRSVITIDVWKRIFPNAKIIHIYRNPFDIAASLKKRSLLKQEKFKYNNMDKFKRHILKGKTFTYSLRVQHIEEGIKLWECYVKKAFSLEDSENEIIHIQYEDFLTHPKSVLLKIIEFIGDDLIFDEGEINKINSSRKFAFIHDDEMMSIYENFKANKLIQKLGYGDIDMIKN